MRLHIKVLITPQGLHKEQTGHCQGCKTIPEFCKCEWHSPCHKQRGIGKNNREWHRGAEAGLLLPREGVRLKGHEHETLYQHFQWVGLHQWSVPLGRKNCSAPRTWRTYGENCPWGRYYPYTAVALGTSLVFKIGNIVQKHIGKCLLVKPASPATLARTSTWNAIYKNFQRHKNKTEGRCSVRSASSQKSSG